MSESALVLHNLRSWAAKGFCWDGVKDTFALPEWLSLLLNPHGPRSFRRR